MPSRDRESVLAMVHDPNVQSRVIRLVDLIRRLCCFSNAINLSMRWYNFGTDGHETRQNRQETDAVQLRPEPPLTRVEDEIGLTVVSPPVLPSNAGRQTNAQSPLRTLHERQCTRRACATCQPIWTSRWPKSLRMVRGGKRLSVRVEAF